METEHSVTVFIKTYFYLFCSYEFQCTCSCSIFVNYIQISSPIYAYTLHWFLPLMLSTILYNSIPRDIKYMIHFSVISFSWFNDATDMKTTGYTHLPTYLLNYWLTAWSRVLLEKLIGSQLFKKFPAFYGSRRFNAAFTSARHLSLSWATSTQSMPSHPTSWRLILILSSHLRLGLPSGLFPSRVPTKTLHRPLLSPIRATCPALPILLDLITRAILSEAYRSLNSSLCSFLHSAVTPSLLGPNILLSTLFWNTLSLRSPSMSATKFHSHTKQQAKFKFCVSDSVYFWAANWKTKDSAPNDSKHSLTSICS